LNPVGWIKAIRRRKLRANQIAHHEIARVKTGPKPGPDELLAFTRSRDELVRMPYFLDHYRKLGIGRFVIIDNGSRDGTLDYLVSQTDVDVFSTVSPYGESSSGLAWIERLIDTYEITGWVLVVDIDELLVYERWQDANLHRVASLLDNEGSHALKATLVDMYSGPEPVAGSGPLWEQYRWLDGASYRRITVRGGGEDIIGGPRARIVSAAGEPFDHGLMKYPFFRWSTRWAHSSIHLLKPTPRHNVPRAALLHFKFMDDFSTRAADVQLTSGYHRGGYEYQRYRELLSQGPLDLFYEVSIAYEGVETLIENGLMSGLGLPDKRPA